ncbi:hypothetical protein AV530_012069 [Patagioenas fasciata monilis]|uniref:Uncharacterized protein n=1 Tax=Patagioenas fasciata monilis TaxID=372326 RepID=A0A1V4JUR0_PATFA|nr:hypothetical protein AV530_012069 [Patagioenas fasciata monilis]
MVTAGKVQIKPERPEPSDPLPSPAGPAAGKSRLKVQRFQDSRCISEGQKKTPMFSVPENTRLQPAAGQVTGDPHLPGPDGQYHQPRSSNPALVQVTTQVSLSHQPSASLRLSSRHLRRESPAGAQRQGHLPFPNR